MAFVGHGHPRVVSAITEQAETLLHALGDLHPSAVKIELLEKLCTLAPWPEARAMLGLGGADAVTAALKTAVMATGRPGVIAFEGSYHGLSFAPLAVSGFASRFRVPFQAQLNPHVRFERWPDSANDIDRALESLPSNRSEIGAVIVEPIQGRAGVRIPPPGFLKRLGEICRHEGFVLIADEVFTGLGRCGAWWRSVDDALVPDVICAGKALGGGLPVSACLGREEIMRQWGDPNREAIHTGTFFGDPVGARAALATIATIEDDDLVTVSKERGASFADALRGASLRGVSAIRQAGLMLGIELERDLGALSATRGLLERGYLALPAGKRADVLQLVPPVTLSQRSFEGFIAALGDVLGDLP